LYIEKPLSDKNTLLRQRRRGIRNEEEQLESLERLDN